jgi:hypothetical protein
VMYTERSEVMEVLRAVRTQDQAGTQPSTQELGV